ncbi:MAG TPA: VOC family protein [Asticcacaulis sp.]|nr:VOC family protein [Asticcacaulis sp.]
MHVKNLNHINIQTHDMAKTITFYAELLGLEARDAPPTSPEDRQWLHSPDGQAVIHLNRFGTDNTVPRLVIPGDPTGAIHHVAFECEGFDEALAFIKSRGMDYGYNEIPRIPLRQLFVADPNNVFLELNFRGPIPD